MVLPVEQDHVEPFLHGVRVDCAFQVGCDFLGIVDPLGFAEVHQVELNLGFINTHGLRPMRAFPWWPSWHLIGSARLERSDSSRASHSGAGVPRPCAA